VATIADGGSMSPSAESRVGSSIAEYGLPDSIIPQTKGWHYAVCTVQLLSVTLRECRSRL
jgi:hypothetical protein